MDDVCPNCGGEYVPICPCGDGPPGWGQGHLKALLAERDRLRAVVEAVRDYMAERIAFDTSDAEAPAEQTRRFEAMAAAWNRVCELLDVSGDMGRCPTAIDRREAFAMDAESYPVPMGPHGLGCQCDAGHQDEDGPAIFARARSLLGQQVKVTLSRDNDEPAPIAQGRLLRICEGGEIAIEDGGGFVAYCWPMLDIEPLSEGTDHG